MALPLICAVNLNISNLITPGEKKESKREAEEWYPTRRILAFLFPQNCVLKGQVKRMWSDRNCQNVGGNFSFVSLPSFSSSVRNSNWLTAALSTSHCKWNQLCSESTENYKIKFCDWKWSYHELESLLKPILSMTTRCFLHTLSNEVGYWTTSSGQTGLPLETVWNL